MSRDCNSPVKDGEKWCPVCRHWLPRASFYWMARQMSSYCKRCWNGQRRARENVRCHTDLKYKAAQLAKRREWDRLNPERKRVLEGRAIFLGRADAPEPLLRAERLLMELGRKAL